MKLLYQAACDGAIRLAAFWAVVYVLFSEEFLSRYGLVSF